jgi:probable rRNA maturation factor
LAFDLAVQEDQKGALNERALRRRVRAVCAALGLRRGAGSIVLVDDEQIHKLNKTYRHKDRPTDVLAFAMQEGEFAELSPELLGDVVVSVPTAAKQALEEGRPLLEEVTMLVVHGILHLLGWDHDTVRKDLAMRKETERLCRIARGGAEKSGPAQGRPRMKKNLKKTNVSRRSGGPARRSSRP